MSEPAATLTPEQIQARQLSGLARLVELGKAAREAEDVARLGFVIANDTHRLCPYRQAVLLLGPDDRSLRVQTVSGLPDADRHAPFIVWMQRLARRKQAIPADKLAMLDLQAMPERIRAEWSEWLPTECLSVRLLDLEGRQLGVLLLARDDVWSPAEQTLLAELADTYAHALAALQPTRKGLVRRGLKQALAVTIVVALVFALVTVRVTQSALGEAEVIAADAVLVRAPLNGVIDEVAVRPNQSVAAGELLFTLDATELRNETELARHAAAVAEAEYRQAAQSALFDTRSKSRLAVLQGRLEQRLAELRYRETLLSRVEVRASRRGVTVFGRVSDWQGKAVSLGEKVMQLADPRRVELEVLMPVDEAVTLRRGAPVRLFLNIDPQNPLDATVQYASYRAEPTAEGVTAYRMKAVFGALDQPPRIGLKGTAKVSGEEVALGYFLFRRPFATARRWLGL
ncbi:MAG: HlyD family efflux transporter periplasmic adaptor subunit [Pseudomonadota bacterium]